MNRSALLAVAVTALVAACGSDPDPRQYGAQPALPEPSRGLLPSMTIADPAPWGRQRPTGPPVYAITPIATDLKIPRQTLLLPNGDILVSEGKGGGYKPKLMPKDLYVGIGSNSNITERGEHGSWIRKVPVGYKVVFVPFRDGRPAGPPVDFGTGFMGADGKTRGRPVGVTVDPRGALKAHVDRYRGCRTAAGPASALNHPIAAGEKA